MLRTKARHSRLDTVLRIQANGGQDCPPYACFPDRHFSSVERNFFTHTYLSFLFFLKSNQSHNTLAGVRNHIAKSIEVLNLDSKYVVVNPYFIKSNIPNKNSKPIKFPFFTRRNSLNIIWILICKTTSNVTCPRGSLIHDESLRIWISYSSSSASEGWAFLPTVFLRQTPCNKHAPIVTTLPSRT